MGNTLLRNESVVWRKLDGKAVIIGADAQSVYTLNKTATRIWELCDGNKTIDEIAADICEKFDVTSEEAQADVRDTIMKFEKMKLIERKITQ